MKDNNPPSDPLKTHLLTWLLGAAIALVAGAIAWVGWNCIDSVQKNAKRLSGYHTTAENTEFDPHRYELLKEDVQNSIEKGDLSPNVAIQEAIQKLEGSEVLCNKGLKAMDMQQYAQAADYFSQVLAMIAAEAEKKTFWHVGGHRCNRKAYTAYAYEQRSFCCLKLTKYGPAIADLTKAIKLRPDYPVNYQNRATAYYLLGQKALAAADIKTAKKLPPLNASAYP